MRSALKNLFVLTIFLLPQYVKAHPVTFKGGIAVMDYISPGRNDLMLHYSFSARQSVGLGVSRVEIADRDVNFIYPHFNFLIYRENAPDYQANFYLMAGAGLADFDGDIKLASFAGLQLDAESRRLYSAFEINELQSEGSLDVHRLKLRLGAAPYLAEFDELNSWILAEINYKPDSEDEIEGGPLLRFFKSNVFWELGVTTRGKVMGTLMVHF
ncbi:hypothetical protein JNK13_01885 [bacterium]|nr:hypothetical protein [bacterium]